MILLILLPVLIAVGLIVWTTANLIRQVRTKQIIRIRDCVLLGAGLGVCAFALSAVILVFGGLGHSSCAGAQAQTLALIVFVIAVICPMSALFLYRYYQRLMLVGGDGTGQLPEKPDLTRLRDLTTIIILVLTLVITILLGRISLWPPLMFALRNGYTGMAETLIDAGLFLDDRDICGNAPLRYAAMGGKTDLVKRMVEHGAVIDAADKYDVTALSHALLHRNSELARYLVEKGAEVNPSSGTYYTPLMLSAQMGDVDLCEFLIASGADVNAQRPHGSALCSAARNNHLAAARLLLDRGANTEGKSASDWTPLMYACQNGYVDMVKLLLERGANPLAKTYARETPFSLARTNGHGHVLELLRGRAPEPTAEGQKSRH